MTNKTKAITRAVIGISNVVFFTSWIWNVFKPNTISRVVIYTYVFALMIYNLISAHLDLRLATLENNQLEITKLKQRRIIFIVLFISMLIAFGVASYDYHML